MNDSPASKESAKFREAALAEIELLRREAETAERRGAFLGLILGAFIMFIVEGFR